MYIGKLLESNTLQPLLLLLLSEKSNKVEWSIFGEVTAGVSR